MNYGTLSALGRMWGGKLYRLVVRQTDRQTDRQKDRQVERQADRVTDRLTVRQRRTDGKQTKNGRETLKED